MGSVMVFSLSFYRLFILGLAFICICSYGLLTFLEKDHFLFRKERKPAVNLLYTYAYSGFPLSSPSSRLLKLHNLAAYRRPLSFSPSRPFILRSLTKSPSQ